MGSVYDLIRYALIKIPPEKAHNLFSFSMRKFGHLLRVRKVHHSLKQKVLGKQIISPIGLAAGFDKYAEIFPYLASFGFAVSELGSFTLMAQPGNPKPRIRRFPDQKAIINKMGFNNPGIQKGFENIKKNLKLLKDPQHKIAINIGKSKRTSIEEATHEYEQIAQYIDRLVQNSPSDAMDEINIEDHILYVAINISSPNTPQLRELQSKNEISVLLKGIRKKLKLPLLIKLSPDFSNDKEFIKTLQSAWESGADGFILTNTSTNYSVLGSDRAKAYAFGGGISGSPLSDISCKYLRLANNVLPKNAILIASGGIMTKEDIWKRIVAGSCITQLYTGYVYSGNFLLDSAEKYIIAQLQKRGLHSLEELIQNREYIQKEKK